MPSPAIDRKQDLQKKSGALVLFTPLSAGLPAHQAYVRFKVCRGFIDDLNRILPIRVRIELETRIASGDEVGEVPGPQGAYRWQFQAGA